MAGDRKLLAFPGRESGQRRYSAELKARLVGQDEAVMAVTPFLEIFEARLSPPDRPAGVFLLLGPTGTGKTKTVEALAEVLHGSASKHLRIDCGEFQMDHEVAKLIGAPPGYLGHRETTPMINQQKVNACSSEASDLSLILFDEIEKAAPSLVRLLLGVLDKASLRLGDGTAVDFQRSLIFMTSNVGAERISRLSSRPLGFDTGEAHPERITQAALSAMRAAFPPEFVNRIDRAVCYRPLDELSLERILDLELNKLSAHMVERLGADAPALQVSEAARRALLAEGASREFGARELKRVLYQRVLHPVAIRLLHGRAKPGSVIRIQGPAQDGNLVLEAAA